MASTDKFVGYLVSVDCKDIFYQGVVTQIDPNKALIQLKNVFQNGIHCGSKLVDIKTTEIDNIEILADPPNAFKLLNPKAAETEQPVLKLSDETNKSAAQPHQQQQQPKVSKHIKTSNSYHSMHSYNSSNNNNNHNNSNISPASSSPPYNNNDKYSNKRKAHHNDRHQNQNNQREASSDSNTMNVDQIEEDFDFEKNLALFDKNKMYEELGHPVLNTTPATESTSQLNAYDSLVKQLNSQKQSGSDSQMSGYHKISVANLFQSQTPSMAGPVAPAPANGLLTPNTNGLIAASTKTPVINSSSGGRNYRFDEMVLGTGEPVNFQQIQVPYDLGKQYVTDDGFVVPCIDVETRHKLFENSYHYGFNRERQIESMGRCCTEMAIQLIGGPLRFSIKNNHQKPTILILVNEATLQGSYALCAARMLLTRSCKVHIFVVKSTEQQRELNESKYFENELKLFESTEPVQNTFIKSIEELRTITSVDLILNSVDGSMNSQSWYRSLVKYVESCKASVLSIDPVAEGSAIKSKWCILPMLPMPMDDSCGRVYLCDLGFTKSMFNSVNIKYQSPFGAKFCIPLHND